MEINDLLVLLKEFIVESKEADVLNTKEHKEITACNGALKIQLSKVEALCEAASTIRHDCFKKQDDLEDRMRTVEKIIPGIKELPDKFDKLAVKVYGIMGAMTVVMVVVSWVLRK